MHAWAVKHRQNVMSLRFMPSAQFKSNVTLRCVKAMILWLVVIMIIHNLWLVHQGLFWVCKMNWNALRRWKQWSVIICLVKSNWCVKNNMTKQQITDGCWKIKKYFPWPHPFTRWRLKRCFQYKTMTTFIIGNSCTHVSNTFLQNFLRFEFKKSCFIQYKKIFQKSCLTECPAQSFAYKVLAIFFNYPWTNHSNLPLDWRKIGDFLTRPPGTVNYNNILRKVFSFARKHHCR